MKQLWLLPAAALLLGTGRLPPPRPAEPPRLNYASLDCIEVREGVCTELAYSLAPPPPLAEAVPAATSADAPTLAEPAYGAVRVLVSIPQQKAYVFKGGKLVATSRVSTGKRGHATPTGTFPILQKKVKHRSNLYANAPMPYMQRLTHGGVALHAGHVPGYPASHGCIRLPWSFARKLYGLTDHGTKVTITSRRPKSTEAALNLA